MKWLALIAVLLATPAAAEDPWKWTKTDTVHEVAFTTLVFFDWQQTRWALFESGIEGAHEQNPLIGRHPSKTRLDLMALGGVLAHAAISRALPAPYRRVWQMTSFSVEGGAVVTNAAIVGGFKFDF